ncbi:hypothetical protein SteCoe_3971 [Stentor coeruleus]|uniref:HOOK N-terminal domain-containing protein n=1 Tax=Stentor coeruleus TaxID=5963 RepID=A0A1R2CW04_9CILI|nr:hypothetical protein SteCoe_3971 [Stentor coeruleus]
MEDLNFSIVNWINKNNLTKKCHNLADLSDGIILFELLSHISQDIFDLGSITLDIQNNWALKLANLRRLKKAIDNYLTNVIQVPYVQFNEIRLGSIARKASNEDIIKFLELVFVVIINCPQKEAYIRRIMELDEKSQYCLMLFIKKALGDGNEDLIQDTEFNKKEIEILRNEKSRMAAQILEIQQELNKFKEVKDQLVRENEELKMSNIDLQHQIQMSPTRQGCEKTELYHRLEKKLAEKAMLVDSLQEQLKEIKNKYERELAQIRDELDISHAKNYQFKQSEKVVETLKKKVEKMTAMKKRLIELKRNNENMEKLIIEHQDEIESYQQYKKSSIYYKEEYTKEREKMENLLVALESKEKQISKFTKTINEMGDKILYQENRIHELEAPIDGSFASEDSFNFGKIDQDADVKRANRNFQGFLAPPLSGQSDLLIKEITNLKTLLIKKKARVNMYKETINMQNEEMNCRNYYNATLITQLSSRNEAMADRLQTLSENISNIDNDKERLKQSVYELNSLKNYKDTMLSEIKNLYEEKDIIYKKYVAGREEVIVLNNKIHEKEFIVRDLELNLRLMNDKFKSFESTAVECKPNSGDMNERVKSLEQQNRILMAENNEMHLRIREKEDKINDLIRAREESIKVCESEHAEAVIKLKHEFEWKSEQMVRQAEDAISLIQKEKDDLQSRLNIEKKNNLLEWKRAMILKDPSMIFTEENNRLKLNVAELEKENEKLLRTNQELTICWKESARMVKNISRLVDCETKRMQKIMSQKQ